MDFKIEHKMVDKFQTKTTTKKNQTVDHYETDY